VEKKQFIMEHRNAIFYPKLLSIIRSYTLNQFGNDLTAGVIVGIVALPLAIAFAIASGVTPDRGLVTAIIAGFLISALGGSRVQIGGPTGAFVIIIYGIVAKYGIDGLIISTMMAGIMLVLMGSFRLGAMIKFIPYPVTVGFTAGIAVVIFSSQIKDFLGLPIAELPGEFIAKWGALIRMIPALDLPTTLLSAVSLAVLILWPRVTRRIPGSIIIIILGTAAVHFFHIPVDTIGSRFGDIPSGLPAPHWPNLNWSDIRHLVNPAFTIAMLGAIESLLSATVSDGMIESRHRSNTELIAQGIANIVTPLFGGIPATGAIARTATNVRNGGRTPVAGMVHSVVLLLIVMLVGKWATLIPLAVLAAILIMVAYHMSEWHAFKSLLKAPRMDVMVLIVTFALTVLVDLTAAVEIGLILSAVLFIKRMTDVTTIKAVTRELQNNYIDGTLKSQPDSVSRQDVPKGVEIYEAEGAFFFGVAEALREALTVVENPPKVMILRMRHVLALDATGIQALLDMRRWCHKASAQLVLEGVHAQPLIAIENAGLLETFGQENLTASISDALTRARQIIG
jgi:SulP family sulfate permease